MTDNDRKRIEAFIRIRQFGADNATDFPAGSVGAQQLAVINAVVEEVGQFAGEQAEGFGGTRQAFASKSTARENLREELYDIARTARAMQYQIDGIELKFQMPVNRNDQNLLATARAFYTESAEYDADFQAYGLDAEFRTDLQKATDAFELSMNPPGTAIDEQVASTAEIGDTIRRGMIARRILEGVVKNIYRSNVGKLAAWLSASHIERVPKAAKPATPV